MKRFWTRACRPWLLAVACLLALFGPAAPAAASCPPLDIERTPLGFLGLEAQRRLTTQDREAILRGGVIPGVPVGVWPPHGPAPLQVGLIWLIPPEDPDAIELDVDGDGVAEIIDTRNENFGHTYNQPGRYAAVVRVRDRQGRTETYSSPVTVVTREAFEAELQTRWAPFRTALKRRSLAAALDCLHSAAQSRHESDVQALLGRDVEALLPPIRFVEARVIDALFVSVRPAAGRIKPLEVHFGVDLDGVWRLGAFGDSRGGQ